MIQEESALPSLIDAVVNFWRVKMYVSVVFASWKVYKKCMSLRMPTDQTMDWPKVKSPRFAKDSSADFFLKNGAVQ